MSAAIFEIGWFAVIVLALGWLLYVGFRSAECTKTVIWVVCGIAVGGAMQTFLSSAPQLANKGAVCLLIGLFWLAAFMYALLYGHESKVTTCTWNQQQELRQWFFESTHVRVWLFFVGLIYTIPGIVGMLS